MHRPQARCARADADPSGRINIEFQGGDPPVSIGELLVEIDTYNMTQEIRAPATGILSKILVKDGGSADPGTVFG